MTADRPYRRGLKREHALEELRRNAGTQFFPEVVDAFIALHQSGALFAALDPDEELLFTKVPDQKAA